jgi:PKD repeat protein
MAKLIYVFLLIATLSSCSKSNDETVESSRSGSIMQNGIGFDYTIDDASRTVEFTNKSVGVKNPAWFFGDGETTKEDSPKHVYAKAGKYTVMFSVRMISTELPEFITKDIIVGKQ